jgi:hypothetical protein
VSRVVCGWCDNAVEQGDGFRLGEQPGNRGAAFCRLEHIVPWAMGGARWQDGHPFDPSGLETERGCAHCGNPLGDAHLLLVRHRCLSGQLHRIPDAFCSLDHLLAWAKAGGRWRS